MPKSIDTAGVVGDLKDGLDDILGLRDDLGAALMEVYIVTRVWSGSEIGDGNAVETKSQLQPSPRITRISSDNKALDGGVAQLGDILLTGLSKKSYENKYDIDGTSNNEQTDMFYEVDGDLYKVIDVQEKHLTWNVLIRKQSNQKRYVGP